MEVKHMSQHRRPAVTTLLLVLGATLAPYPASAEAGPIGHRTASEPIGDTIIVSALPEDQVEPAIAYNQERREYLVVWYNDRPGLDDIYAQRLDSNGAPTGPWIAISYGPGADRWRPAVAWNSARDEYLVIWDDNASIRGRRVSGSGQPLGGEIAIDGGLAGGDKDAHLAYASAQDSYLVVWQNSIIKGQLIEEGHVLARVVSSEGLPQATPVYLSQGFGGNVRWPPRVAYNRSRNEYLVAWAQWDIFAAHNDVYARRVQGDGTPMFPESIPIFQGPNDQAWVDVTAMPTRPHEGLYLVTWVDWMLPAQVRAQRLDGLGTLLGLPIALGPCDVMDASCPAAAANEHSATFLVAWAHTYWQPYVFGQIHVRELDKDGALDGPVLVLPGRYAGFPTTAAGGPGDLFVAYQDRSFTGPDHDIFGQLFGQHQPSLHLYLPVLRRNAW